MHPEITKAWGKARPEGEGAQFHLLVYHALDVTAVGATYLRHSPALLGWLKHCLGIRDDEILIRWVCFWLALHDLGKFSLSFQAQRPDIMARLQGDAPHTRGLPHVRHDSLGMWFWEEELLYRSMSEAWFGPDDESLIDGVSCWARAVTGHHGQPPLSNPTQMHLHFRPQDKAAAHAFVDAMRQQFLPPGEARGVSANGSAAFVRASQRVSWWVAGMAVLADWIGSNATVFRYHDEPTLSLEHYWDRALTLADQALTEAGVLPVAVRPRMGIDALFPMIQTPSPLQRWAADVELCAAPQMHLLEDVTGAGKTEAALMLTHRLMAIGAADGFFIGLPTMATANAMYGRMAACYGRLFDGDASLVLAHGRKDLVDGFALSVISPGREEHDPAQLDDSATSRCARWLADHNKRALLAPAGVGTIDQALLGALQSKHQCLRLLGLFRKVLIVDEVHACDAYMQRTLESLLEFHAAAGGSAILLSATLPGRMKQALLKAYARGRNQKAPQLATRPAFPLITSWTTTAEGLPAVQETPIATRPDVRRSVRVHYESDVSKVLDLIIRALDAGQCVAWIRNTVADALQARELVLPHVAAQQVTLFHARFTLGDRLDVESQVLNQLGPDSTPERRRGQLLIATQVAEQSLDIDVDLLVSDLAPVDRLIQRAGRMRRHARDSTGRRLAPGCADERGEPWLWVYGPAWTESPSKDWFKDTFPKAAYVYEDHAQLWLGARQLQSGAFTMPDDARALIESVYGDDAVLPDSLVSSSTRADGKAHAERSTAQVNSVKLDAGYERSGADWLADTAAPSRLGEESVDVVLARWQGDQLLPWRNDKLHYPWAYSTVRVPRRLIDQPLLPDSAARQVALTAARASMPGGGKWVVLLALEAREGRFVADALTLAGSRQSPRRLRWGYDARTGLVADVTPGGMSPPGATTPQE